MCVEDGRVSNLGSPAPRRSSGRRSFESDRSVARSALGVQDWAREQAAKPVSPRSILQALPNTCECTRAREYCDWQRKSKEYLAFELNPCASAARETVRTAGRRWRKIRLAKRQHPARGRGSVRVEREVAEALLNFETISGTLVATRNGPFLPKRGLLLYTDNARGQLV